MLIMFISPLIGDSRALIYQKYLLADNPESKIELLFLLKELFQKDNLTKVLKNFKCRLQEIDKNDIRNYQEVVEKYHFRGRTAFR